MKNKKNKAKKSRHRLKLKKEGRPTVITKSVISKLEKAFSYGCSDEEACFYAGLSMATLYRFQEKSPEFCERKRIFKKKPMFLARKKLISGIQKDANLAYKYLRDRYNSELEKEGREYEIETILERNMPYIFALIARELNEEKRKKILLHIDQHILKEGAFEEKNN